MSRSKICIVPMSLVVVLGASACGGGRLVARDEAPVLTSEQGFIAIAADINERTALLFCRDADMIHCVDIGPLPPEDALAVTLVPAGRYCLVTVACEAMGGVSGHTRQIEPEKSSCFDVAPGTISYPGHFVYRVRETPTMMIHVEDGWEKRDTFEATVRAAYPKLASWPVRTVRIGGVRK